MDLRLQDKWALVTGSSADTRIPDPVTDSVGNDDQRHPFGTTLEGCASRTAATHCTPCRRPRDTRRRQGYLSH